MKNINVKFPQVKKYVRYEVEDNSTLLDFIIKNTNDYKQFLGAVADSELVSLRYAPKEDENISLLNIKNSLGQKIYNTSLSLIFQMAIKEIFKERYSVIEHYVGSSIYSEFIDNIPYKIEEVKKIESVMRRIVSENLPIVNETWSRDRTLDFYCKNHRMDNIKLINTTDKKEFEVSIVKDYVEKFVGVLVPSTGFIDKFALSYYYPGVLIRFPSKNKNYELDMQEESAKLSKALNDHNSEANIIGVSYTGELNEKILNGEDRDLILVSESFLDKKIREIAMKIVSDSAKRVVLISGPSSSGKTTFAQKLRIALKMYGRDSIEMSTDDYFVPRNKTPKNPDGSYDFETVDAVDIDELNKDIMTLMEGEGVRKRGFDFIDGKPIYGGEINRLSPNGIIILEGIHALNPLLSINIPNKNKLKLYLSALTTMNLDMVNRLSTTDVRFLRRMVRDVRTRGRSVSVSLAEWANVRQGEDKYVFPFQEEADIIVNTSLFYEIAVIKKHALKLLKEVPKNDKNYVRATRLIDMLSDFVSIEDDGLVPNTSLLREFIGGSVFE